MNTQSYERLEKVIEWAGLSTHAFGMKIGMKRSENLYRIIRNKENVSIKLIMLILETYPEINRNWMIHGEGKMTIEETKFENYNKIPVYDRSFDRLIDKPLYHIDIPMFGDSEYGVFHNDKSMEPIIPFGSIIVLKKSTTNVIYGQAYFIETDSFSIARIIRKSDISEEMFFVLEAADTNNYDTIIIRKDEIVNIYMICGTLTAFC